MGEMREYTVKIQGQKPVSVVVPVGKSGNERYEALRLAVIKLGLTDYTMTSIKEDPGTEISVVEPRKSGPLRKYPVPA